MLTFSEAVRKGNGNVVIRPASGPDIVIPVTDNQVRVSGRRVTIDPTANLAANTAYHVRIAGGAIEDLAGNDHAGIADATTWTFTTDGTADTTAPELSTYNTVPHAPSRWARIWSSASASRCARAAATSSSDPPRARTSPFP